MKLKKFRIKNYKSIKDTGICNFHPDVTIFAGKNESGKSSLIEAFRDFSPEEEVNIDAVPMGSAEKPSIELFFELNSDNIKQIEEELNSEFVEEIKSYLLQNPLGLIKFDNKYSLNEKFVEIIENIDKKNCSNSLSEYKKIINELKKIEIFNDIEFIEFNKNISNPILMDFTNSLKKHFDKKTTPQKVTTKNPANPEANTVVEKPAEIQLEDEIKEKIQNLLNQLNACILPVSGIYYHVCDLLDDLSNTLIEKVPPIIFFDDFNDKFPFEVSIEELESKKVVKDFCKLAGIDIDVIKNEKNLQHKMNYLRGKSAEISSKFKEDWIQDVINIEVHPQGDSIIFSIKEAEGENSAYLFRPDQRSKGFQWFLSFYIRLNAQDSNDKIILIDEPGLYLHAKAQEDVLKVLEQLSAQTEDTKVIISTHSPYFIDMDNLNRVNLVEKRDKKGTIIEKVHKNANQETLTPIITKMGFDISRSNFINEKNILLEGISDYYYILAMKEIIKPKYFVNNNISFIPHVGATKIPQTASILKGWGLKQAILLDNDSEGKKVKTSLKKIDVEEEIIFVKEDTNTTIEKLFTLEDYQTHINNNGASENTSKEVIAREFYEKSLKNKGNIQLAKETIDNFTDIFEKAQKILENV